MTCKGWGGGHSIERLLSYLASSPYPYFTPTPLSFTPPLAETSWLGTTSHITLRRCGTWSRCSSAGWVEAVGMGDCLGSDSFDSFSGWVGGWMGLLAGCSRGGRGQEGSWRGLLGYSLALHSWVLAGTSL